MPINCGVGLGHDKVFFLVGREEIKVLFDPAIFNFAVRSLNETELIDSSESRKARNQADVRAFRSFDRTDPPVMGRMHVADFEPGTLATQTPWSKRGKTPFVGHFAERIGLIHQLRELTPPEEIPNHGRKGLGIDQFLRRHAFSVHVEQRHTLLDQSFRTAQAGPALIRQKFTNGPHSATAQMIDIVCGPLSQTEVDQIAGRCDHIFPSQNPGQ